jgi:hypothetical protein
MSESGGGADLPVRAGASDRPHDIEFWQKQGSTAIFAAAWEMVVEAYRLQNRDERELEFQKSVECMKRMSR